MLTEPEAAPQYGRLFHADWSVSPNKRWMATADWVDGWRITAVEPVGSLQPFLDALLDDAKARSVLAGFDFPIGVPERYGKATGLCGFLELLQVMGSGRWQQFGTIAREPNEISLERPFYPAGAQAGLKQLDLLRAHDAASLDDIRRQCERATRDRRAACPLFWTLGGNQVGRGALSGWQELVGPAIRRGASVWPFDGDLAELSMRPGLVIAETYPAEAYGHIGVSFGARQSKTDQGDRKSQAAAILAWANASGVALDAKVEALVKDGFGNGRDGEDRFDALIGLAGMIEVASGRRQPGGQVGDVWEGWILGQGGGPTAPVQPSRSIEARGAPTSSFDLHGAKQIWTTEADPATDALVRDLLLVWNGTHQNMPIVGPWFEARVRYLVGSWIDSDWCVSGPSQVFDPLEPGLRSRSWDLVIHRRPTVELPPPADPRSGWPLIPVDLVAAVIDTKTNFSDAAGYAAQTCFNQAHDSVRLQTDLLGSGVACLVLAATTTRSLSALHAEGARTGVQCYALGRYKASKVATERSISWELGRMEGGVAPLQAFKHAVRSAVTRYKPVR